MNVLHVSLLFLSLSPPLFLPSFLPSFLLSLSLSFSLDPQSFCKAAHRNCHPSPSTATTNSPQHKRQQRSFSPSIRLTRSNAASKYRRDNPRHHQIYSLVNNTTTTNSDGSVVTTAGQKRPALVASLNLANTSGEGLYYRSFFNAVGMHLHVYKWPANSAVCMVLVYIHVHVWFTCMYMYMCMHIYIVYLNR